MNNPSVQFTLREWRRHMTQPTVVVILLAVTAIVGIAGPFETAQFLGLLPRLGYWLVIVVGSYSCGFIIDSNLGPRLSQRPDWQKIAVTGLLTGFCVVAIVLVMNIAIFGMFLDWSGLPYFVVPILVISLIVNAAGEFLGRQQDTQRPAAPRILDRIPLDKRGGLVALSVEDHYVRVQTTKGEEMVLIRLGDAITEVGATTGAQVHRSHWVAFDHVTAARREGDRAVLTMSNDAQIPVSRANVAKIKEAGLLPA